MLDSLSSLALEVKSLDAARAFYAETLGLAVDRADDTEVALAAGDTALVLRRPTALPRGGLHTHFAFSIPAAEYDDWWARLDEQFALHEERFDTARSLYCYDPDGNCVELGQRDVAGPGIDGIFEVVLEVADLDAALGFYTDLGFSVVDEGADRKRVRLQGPMALELWEPHLGIADGRGGVHVDLGFTAADPAAVADAVGDRVREREVLGDGAVRVQDPDGHWLTIEPADA